MPEVASGGSLEHSAPAAVFRITSAVGLSHVGLHCQGLDNTTFPNVHKAQRWAPSLLWAGRKCRCGGLSAHTVAVPWTVKLSQCLLKCHDTIIWCPKSWVRGQGWDMVQAELPSVSLLCFYISHLVLGCRTRQHSVSSALECYSRSGLARWVSPTIPMDFRMVERAKMHQQLLWKVHPALVSWISQSCLSFHSL